MDMLVWENQVFMSFEGWSKQNESPGGPGLKPPTRSTPCLDKLGKS